MKILILSDTFFPQINGVTNTMRKMAAYYRQLGISYKMVGPGDGDGQCHEDQQVVLKGYPLPFYPECRLALPALAHIRRRIGNFVPDIIHAMTPFSMGLTAIQLAKEYQVPLVTSYTTHFTVYLKHYNLQLLEKPIWNYFRWFHQQAALNYCPSEESRQLLKSQGIERIACWGRGVECDRFSPQNRSQALRKTWQAENKPVLLYVGRLAPEKDLPVLVKAMEGLNRKGYDYTTVIVGDGPSRETLQKTYPDNLILAGYQRGKELQTHYASADVFAFPSASETYGNVILEAMASGLPVVAPCAGGVTENLLENRNGFYFIPGSSDSMEQQLEKLLLQPELRRRMALEARRHAMTRQWPALFDALLEDYASLIRQHKPRRSTMSA